MLPRTDRLWLKCGLESWLSLLWASLLGRANPKPWTLQVHSDTEERHPWGASGYREYGMGRPNLQQLRAVHLAGEFKVWCTVWGGRAPPLFNAIVSKHNSQDLARTTKGIKECLLFIPYFEEDLYHAKSFDFKIQDKDLNIYLHR